MAKPKTKPTKNITPKNPGQYARKKAMREARAEAPYVPPTGQRLMFCNEYLLDFKVGKAYTRAGYKSNFPSIAGHDLLKDPNIRRYIDERMKELVDPLRISQERIVNELALLGFANIQDYIVIDKTTGYAYIDLTSMSREEAAAITEFSVDDMSEGRGEEKRDFKRLKIKLADKRAALVDLAKYVGGYKEASSMELTGANGGPVKTEVTRQPLEDLSGLTDEQLAARYREEVRKA